jgi:hypothetical protein
MDVQQEADSLHDWLEDWLSGRSREERFYQDPRD